MPISAHESWIQNLRSKIQDLRKSIDTTYKWIPSSGAEGKAHFEIAAKELTSKLEAFFHLYGSDTTPKLLKELRDSVNQWIASKEAPQFARKVFTLYNELDQLAEFVEEPSFEQIFQSYKEDGRLQELLEELIKAIKSILAEGGDVLTAKMAKELELIVAELQRHQKKSVIDVSPWVELSLQSLAAIADASYGTVINIIVVNAGLVAFRTRKHIAQLYHRAKQALLARPGMKSLGEAGKFVRLLSEKTTEEEARLLLEAPKDAGGAQETKAAG